MCLKKMIDKIILHFNKKNLRKIFVKRLINSHVFLVVFHDPDLQLCILVRDELVGRQVGVVGVVLHDVVTTFGWKFNFIKI